MNELPTMCASGYTSSAIHLGMPRLERIGNPVNAANLIEYLSDPQQAQNQVQQTKEVKVPSARIVKIFIADPNENLSLESRVLYQGEEKLTDLTDQELFYEVPISDLLKKHNELRAKTLDKSTKGPAFAGSMLEPARIRDLKMVVVTIAQF